MCDCCSGNNEEEIKEECCGDENCDCDGTCDEEGCGCGGHSNDEYETWTFAMEQEFSTEIAAAAEKSQMEFEEFIYNAIEMALAVSRGELTVIDNEAGIVIEGDDCGCGGDKD